VESCCKLGNEHSVSIKCWELPSGCTSCGLSSGTQLHRVRLLVNRATVKCQTLLRSCSDSVTFGRPMSFYSSSSSFRFLVYPSVLPGRFVDSTSFQS
jgi:hypothetical protein